MYPCSSTLFCKKDTITPPVATITTVSEPKAYKDESTGSLSFSKPRRSRLNPDIWDIFYVGQANGTSTFMSNTRTVCSFYKSTGTSGSTCGGNTISTLSMDDRFADNFPLIPNYVNQVVYDDSGNSIWFQIISLSIENSADIQHFSGVSNIVGGTGKYTSATGTVQLNGHMSLFNSGDFYIKNEGHISY